MQKLIDRERTYRQRMLRQTFAETRRRAKEEEKRFFLVTSVDHQAGRTRLLSLMRREAHAVAPGEAVFISAQNLRTLDPGEFFGYDLVFVDGPPVVDGAGALDIPPRWIEAFDAAIVVVVKRRTPRGGLTATRDWLEANNIPIFGIVWNEWLNPPLFVALSKLRRWMKGRNAEVPHLAPNTSGDDE